MLAGSRTVTVPWSEVKRVTSRVQLVSRAEDLGLAADEERAARLLPPIPAPVRCIRSRVIRLLRRGSATVKRSTS